MSVRVSQALDGLHRVSSIPNPWVGSRYEWFKQLSGAEAGKLGERLAQAVLGGRLMGRNAGFDLTLQDGRRVEVKLCRRSYSEGNVWSWKQIRRDDEYDLICLVAVEPSSARMFLVPRDQIPAGVLINQHGRGGDGTLCQIAHPKPELPNWITQHEIK